VGENAASPLREFGNEMTAEVQKPEPAKLRGRSSRRQTLVFVSVFVVSVLTLLIGYRYAIDTAANDWYLFQVARHTSWMLDKIGDSSELESARHLRVSAAEVRAVMAAWSRGEEVATPEAIAGAAGDALSSWEVYQYRLKQGRRMGFKGALGPRVAFVLQPTIPMRIEEAQAQRKSIEADAALSAEDRTAQLGALDKEIEGLREQLRELNNSKPRGRGQGGRFFHFVVIPECGAIEVMAIFFAAVLAFPTRWWKRLAGIAAGVPIMYAVNILRLSCLAVIGALTNGGKWFKFSHEYVWQAIYLVFVVAVWLAWVEYVVKRKEG